MELLYLKHKRKQLLEQDLSLPVIHEKILPPAPQTSARTRKQKHPVIYASQTGLSPEQQYLQDQISLLFHSKPKQPSTSRPSLKSAVEDSSKKKHIKNVSLPHICLSAVKIKPNNQPKLLRELSHRPRASLDSILQNQSEFINQYFTQLKHKQKKNNIV